MYIKPGLNEHPEKVVPFKQEPDFIIQQLRVWQHQVPSHAAFQTSEETQCALEGRGEYS